jgi:ADP-ribosylglycohydrolase
MMKNRKNLGCAFGQLAGAYYGFDAIPRRWVEKVKNTAVVANEINRFLAKVGVS